MKSLLTIPLFLLALNGAAHATSYYVSDCGTGSTSKCVAGNDSNTGTSQEAPWKTCDKVTSKFPSLAAGDQILFARGSAQNACKLYYLSNLNSRAANPIILGAYVPSWGTSATATPILNATTSTYALALRNLGNATHDEGYVVQDLHFVGPGVNSTMPALMMSNDVKYVTIRRIEVEGFRLGIQCDGGTNNPLSPGSDGVTEHIVIRDSNIHHNRGIGLLNACNDTLVENNRFDNNGVGMLDHHIYLTNSGVLTVASPTKQVVIRGNTLTNNSPYASSSAALPTPGLCGAVALVVHGLQDGLVIENNVVAEPTVPASGSCWGISADSGGYGAKEGFTNVTIRGNTVINYALGIGLDLCDSCVIENNYVYAERPGSAGIGAPSKAFDTAVPGNTVNNKLTVRNNTVYMKNPTQTTVAVRVSRDGANHSVASNLAYFGSGSTATTACFNTAGLPTTAFTTFDYNLCYFSATPGVWDATRTSLGSQRSAGFDLHSLTANPMLITPLAPNFASAMVSNSPAVKAGHPNQSSKFSIGGVRRDTVSDIGAQQLGSVVVVPNTPTSTAVQ